MHPHPHGLPADPSRPQGGTSFQAYSSANARPAPRQATQRPPPRQQVVDPAPIPVLVALGSMHPSLPTFQLMPGTVVGGLPIARVSVVAMIPADSAQPWWLQLHMPPASPPPPTVHGSPVPRDISSRSSSSAPAHRRAPRPDLAETVDALAKRDGKCDGIPVNQVLAQFTTPEERRALRDVVLERIARDIELLSPRAIARMLQGVVDGRVYGATTPLEPRSVCDAVRMALDLLSQPVCRAKLGKLGESVGKLAGRRMRHASAAHSHVTFFKDLARILLRGLAGLSEPELRTMIVAIGAPGGGYLLNGEGGTDFIRVLMEALVHGLHGDEALLGIDSAMCWARVLGSLKPDPVQRATLSWHAARAAATFGEREKAHIDQVLHAFVQIKDDEAPQRLQSSVPRPRKPKRKADEPLDPPRPPDVGSAPHTALVQKSWQSVPRQDSPAPLDHGMPSSDWPGSDDLELTGFRGFDWKASGGAPQMPMSWPGGDEVAELGELAARTMPPPTVPAEQSVRDRAMSHRAGSGDTQDVQPANKGD